MRLEQRLTPQLIQSMAILQKPVADLEAYIRDALESNVALEVAEPQESVTPGVDGEVSGEAAGGGRDGHQEDPRFDRADRFARENGLDWSDRPPFSPRRPSDMGDRDPKMGALANAPGRGISLQEYLLDQWTLVELDDKVSDAGAVLINQLDPDGYLRVPLPEIAASTRPPLEMDDLEKAHAEVRKLEPTGIACRDLIECLLAQLDAQPGDNRIERTLIKDHLDDVVHNRLPAVSKATGYSIGEINEAIRAMRSMVCLHPGYLVGDRDVPPIRPDVIVEYADTGGEITVRLARGNMPALCIRDDVQAMAKTKENGKETRDFARQQVEAATVLIDAVAFRTSRLLEVAGAIIEKQRDFFDIGPEGLKIFRMSALAEELGCDPSTISRTVAEKYMQTPRGIFPLRYFFTGGTESTDGVSFGWDRVKSRVAELVEAEDTKKPLNDDQIAAKLKDEGVEISRRTIAKYRQQLDIPNARQRKVFQ